MQFNIKDMPNTVRLLRLYRVFMEPYKQGEYSLEFVKNEESCIRNCEFKCGTKTYKVFFNQKDAKHVFSSQDCEEDAGRFLKHLEDTFYKKASDVPFAVDPGYTFFIVNGRRWKVKSEMDKLVPILPFSCSSTPHESANDLFRKEVVQ